MEALWGSHLPAFYEALGWSGARQPDDEVCFFQAGGMAFGLWTALGGHGAPGIELAHNVRSPEEVDAVLAEAQRARTPARPVELRRAEPARGGPSSFRVSASPEWARSTRATGARGRDGLGTPQTSRSLGSCRPER